MSAVLVPGDILPARRLAPLSGGPPVAVGAHRSRSQVLVLTHPQPCGECASYLTSLEELADRFRLEKADVLALVGPAWTGHGPPLALPLLVDDGAVGAALSAAGAPTVAVADRFGQLFTLADAGDNHLFPSRQRLLNDVLDIAIRCPECGVPDVPCLTTLPEVGQTSGGMKL